MKLHPYIRQLLRKVDRQSAVNLILAFSVATALIIAAVLVIQLRYGHYGDLGVYTSYGNAMRTGLIPYRDFPIEYPPGVPPILLLASWLGSLLGAFLSGFLVLSLLAVTALLYHQRQRGQKFGMAEVSLLLFPLLPFVFFDLDVFGAIALYVAIWQFSQKRYKFSAASLAIATLIKAYPGICLLGLFWLLPKGQRVTYLKVFGGIMLAVLVPILIFAPKGLVASVTYHSGRPIEFEASAATIGYIGHLFFNSAATIVRNHKSFSLSFPGQEVWANISTAALAVGLLGVAWLTKQKRYWQKQPATLCITLLIAFILLFKVASPQYLVTPLFLVPLANRELSKTRYYRMLIRLFVVSMIVWLQYVYFFRNLNSFNAGGHAALYANFTLVRVMLLAELLIFLLRLGRSKKTIVKEMHP